MNVPKLRFKEFNDNYLRLKYKDVLKIKSGKDQKQVECENGIYPILGTGGQIGKTNSFLYDKPSVLIGRKGTINKPQYMETPFWTVDTLFYSHIYEPNIPKYLFYSFQNVNWRKYDESTGVPSLSSSTIEGVDCNIPSKEEQLKVAYFLSLLDKKIELQSEKIEDLKLFKKGLNKIIYSDCCFIAKIKDIIEEYNERTQKNNQYKILSSTSTGIFFQDEYFNKQAASSNNIGYKIVPRGYITYRSMSDTGEFHFNIQNIIDNGIVSPAYPVFNIKNNIVDKNFLVNYLNENRNFKNKILSAKEGGTRYALSLSKLKELNISLPDYDQQVRYSKVLNICNLKIKLENNYLENLIKFKKILMKNMFV